MAINRDDLGKLGALVGTATLLGGLIRYSTTNEWGINLALVIGGAALLLVGLALNAQNLIAFFTGRSGRLGTNTTLLSLAVIGLLTVGNYLGYRHHKRFDLTSEQLYSLSDQTRKVVAGLQKDVKVLHFAKQDNQALKDLIAEYRGAGQRISYEFVDPEAKPEIAKQYKVTSFGDTVLAAGERTEKLEAGKTTEQDVTNAIVKLTRDKLKTICFTEGHGERSLAGTEAEAYALADTKLKAENYETKSVSLVGGGGVPSECAVLAVIGPKQGFLPPETALVKTYLDGGGKVLLMLDPDTEPGMEDVLKAWNLEVNSNTVVDASLAGQMYGGAAPVVQNYGGHPITSNFGRGMTIFPMAREVKVGSATGTGVTATTLLTTSEQSWAEKEIKPGGAVEFNAGTDTKGPITIGAAANKSLGEKKDARLVVFGDSDFASNRSFRTGRNGDLFLNTMNWLAQDEDLIAIRPKAATNRSVTMTTSQQRMLFWLTAVLLPLIVIGLGLSVWWKRR